MKIIRWLLSHFFLILLIVIVIYGYMFWGNLLGKETPAGKAVAYLSHEFVAVESFVNAVKEQQAKLADKHPKVGKNPVLVKADQPAESGSGGAVINRNIDQNPVSISYSHNQLQMRQNSAGELEVNKVERERNIPQINVVDKAAASNAESSLVDRKNSSQVNNVVRDTGREAKKSLDNFVSPDIKKQLDNVDEHGRILDAAQPGANVRSIWIAARKSYYQRNYVLSEKSYQQVIDNSEDNYDAYGELGNVYFNQGKGKQAAAAYYEAAAILVRRGQMPRARSLVGLLRHLDEPKATQLQQLIDSASS